MATSFGKISAALLGSAAAVITLTGAYAPNVSGDTLVWSLTGVTPTTTEPSNNAGTWDVGTTENWYDTTTSNGTVWVNGDIAEFGPQGHGGTIVTLDDPVTVSGLIGDTSSGNSGYYEIKPSSSSDSITFNNNSTINVNHQLTGSNESLYVAAPLVLASGDVLTVTGGGEFYSNLPAGNNSGLNGNITITGNTELEFAQASIGTSTFNVTSGSSLFLSNTGGTANNAITIAGAGWANAGGAEDGALALFGNWSGNIIVDSNGAEIGDTTSHDVDTGSTNKISGQISGGATTFDTGIYDLDSSTANTQNGTIVTAASGSLDAGIVLAETSGALGTGGLTINGAGAVALDGIDESVANLIGSSGVVISNNNTVGATLTLGGDNSSQTFAGTLEDTNSNAFVTGTNIGSYTLTKAAADGYLTTSGGSLSIDKTGTGTETLSGANSYSGTTTISAGALYISGSLTGIGAVTVDGDAALEGTGSIAGAVTLQDAGAINLVDGSTNTLTLSGGLTTDTGAVLDFEIGSGLTSDQINVSGGSVAINGSTTVNITGLSGFGIGTYNLIDFSSATGLDNLILDLTPGDGYTYKLNTNGDIEQLDVTAAAVPIPATLALVGVGAMGLLLLQRRRKASLDI